jgi:hypothetical protein
MSPHHALRDRLQGQRTSARSRPNIRPKLRVPIRSAITITPCPRPALVNNDNDNDNHSNGNDSLGLYSKYLIN